MAKIKRFPLGIFMKQFSTEAQCREYLVGLRWKSGYVCLKCGCHHAYRLANGRYQCAQCRHQVSVTAGTVLHKTHMPLTQWFLAFYFVCQDKRGISAVQLAARIGTTYKTARFMLKRIRIAMGQRDETHQLDGVIEFDDAYFGGPTAGRKRGRGTEKAKVFVALSLDELGNPRFLKMRVTSNLKQASVKKFARTAFADSSVIHSDGYRSYIPALEAYNHEHRSYDPDSGLLHWLHIVISNAKAFILGTYHGLPNRAVQAAFVVTMSAAPESCTIHCTKALQFLLLTTKHYGRIISGVSGGVASWTKNTLRNFPRSYQASMGISRN